MTRHRLVFVAILSVAGCATERTARREAEAEGATGKTTGYAVREAVEQEDRGDGIAVQMEQGFLSQQAVEEAIHGRFRALTRCYDEASAARDFAGGPVKLRFLVDAMGRPTDVLVVESLLGNFEVERCLVGVGRTIAFSRPQGGATSFEYTLEFRSTGERAVVDLPASDGEAALAALLPRLAADCKQLGAESMAATVYVEAPGSVRSVGLAAATAIDDQAARCVSTTLLATPLAVPVRGAALARLTLELRNQDVVSAPPPKPARVRLSQGRRARRR